MSDKEDLKSLLLGVVPELMKHGKDESVISADNIYIEANIEIREIINKVASKLLLPKSDFIGIENFQKLYDYAQEGKSCLVLSDHYSNFDLPVLFYLLKQKGGDNICEKLISIASKKLSENMSGVSYFAQGYRRIIIHAVRNIDKAKDIDMATYEEERKKGSAINRMALRHIAEKKHKGNIILMFPAGTRYRKSNPETKKGLPQIDSYLKSFDYFMPMSINGCVLDVNENEADMIRDVPKRDTVIIKAGEVLESVKYRDEVLHRIENANHEEGTEKQLVIDSVMDMIYSIHDEVDALKKELKV